MLSTQSFNSSLADEPMDASNKKDPCTLAVALGGNLPSDYGSPIETLVKARPQIEKAICDWIALVVIQQQKIDREIHQGLRWRWSP